jgi:uncharacterized protein
MAAWPLKRVMTMHKADLKAAMRLFIIVFILLFFFGSLAQAGDLYSGMIISQVLFILVPAILFWRITGVEQVDFARLKPLRLEFVPVIVVLSVSMWLLNIVYAATVLTGLVGLGYEPAILIEPPQSVQDLFRLIIVIAVFAGICEEVFFRGAIMPAMEKQGRLEAIIFSSLLFALFHGSLIRLPNTFILGVVIALVVIKSGSLWAGILFHFLNNFYSMLYLYLAGQAETAAEVSNGSIWGLLPLFAIGLTGAVFGFRRLHKIAPLEPLLTQRSGWLPAGWLSWPLLGGLLLFLIMAFFEFATGFGLLD